MTEEYFEEICGLCGKCKMVHDDPLTNLGNPGFVCKECEEKRDMVFSKWTDPREDEEME